MYIRFLHSILYAKTTNDAAIFYFDGDDDDDDDISIKIYIEHIITTSKSTHLWWLPNWKKDYYSYRVILNWINKIPNEIANTIKFNNPVKI